MEFYTLPLICGLFDRLRGSSQVGVSKTIELFLWGLVLASFFTDSYLQISVFAALFTLGGAPGWGQPVASYLMSRPQNQNDLEWWQFSKLKENPLLALFFRGLMWGIPLLITIKWMPFSVIVLIAMGIAMPAAAWLSKSKLFDKGPDTWGWMELLRGVIFGTLVASLSQFF